MVYSDRTFISSFKKIHPLIDPRVFTGNMIKLYKSVFPYKIREVEQQRKTCNFKLNFYLLIKRPGM